MRIASFDAGRGASYGLVVGEGLVDLGRRLGDRYPTARALLAGGAAATDAAGALEGASADHALGAVRLLLPVPDPARIIGIGLNYRSHVGEAAGREPPAFPRVFSRWTDTLVAHGEALRRPRASDNYDYEGELAVIIGKPGRHIPRERALEHVGAYACFNDGSVRDWQKHTTTSGKNFHASGAFGPWMVPAQEIADPAALTLTTRLNGRQVQHASTGELIYDIPTLIAYVSQMVPLAPGDVIATGTPEGVVHHQKQPVWVKTGDVVEVEISGIGILRNPVEEEA